MYFGFHCFAFFSENYFFTYTSILAYIPYSLLLIPLEFFRDCKVIDFTVSVFLGGGRKEEVLRQDNKKLKRENTIYLYFFHPIPTYIVLMFFHFFEFTRPIQVVKKIVSHVLPWGKKWSKFTRERKLKVCLVVSIYTITVNTIQCSIPYTSTTIVKLTRGESLEVYMTMLYVIVGYFIHLVAQSSIFSYIGES